MESLYIQSFCTLRNGTIRLNGEPIYGTSENTPVDDFLRSAYRQLHVDYPKFHKMDVLCKATFLATELMARDAGPYPIDTALIFANRSSSYSSDEKHATGIYATQNPGASPATFVYTLPNIAMGEISIRHQLHSENVFFIFDSYLPEFLVPYTATALYDKQVQQGLCGWTEVTATLCDVLMYRVGRSGSWAHTVANLKRLYNDHE